MRKIFFIICLLSSLCAMAQKTIIMEQEAGVYKIPCKVNGAKMKMVFDTGASSVAISSSIADYLYENDYITKDDIIGTGKAQVADGRIVDNVIINLRDIEIDGIHVQNVEATVSESLASPLLFGQSAIQKLGKISLNGNMLTIENYTKDCTDEQIKEFRNKIRETYYNDKNYYLAAKYLIEKEHLCGLSAQEYSELCSCYHELNDNDNLHNAVTRFENNCPNEFESIYTAYIYTFYDIILQRGKKYNEAIPTIVKSIAIYMKYKDWQSVGLRYGSLGFCYFKLKDNRSAIDAYKKAISYYTQYLGIPNEGVVTNEHLASMYSWLATNYDLYYSDTRNPNTILYMRKAARCGDEFSVKRLNMLGLKIYE